MARYLLRTRKLLLHNILHADDSPHAIAMGCGVAMLVAFLPLVGFQTAIAIGVAALLRANKAVCIPIVWVTNPLTIVPIYGACWKLGQWILASPVNGGIEEELTKLNPSESARSFFDVEFWRQTWNQLLTIGTEMWLGCTIVGVAFGITTYILARRGVAAYRERRRERILRRNLFRAKRAKGRATNGITG